jgi:ankyrin repeat protein
MTPLPNRTGISDPVYNVSIPNQFSARRRDSSRNTGFSVRNHGLSANSRYRAKQPGSTIGGSNDYTEETALFIAAAEGQPRSVALLLSHGADAKARSILVNTVTKGQTITQRPTALSLVSPGAYYAQGEPLKTTLYKLLQSAQKETRLNRQIP